MKSDTVNDVGMSIMFGTQELNFIPLDNRMNKMDNTTRLSILIRLSRLLAIIFLILARYEYKVLDYTKYYQDMFNYIIF